MLGTEADQIEEALDLMIITTWSEEILLPNIFLSNVSKLFKFTFIKMSLNHFTIHDWLPLF